MPLKKILFVLLILGANSAGAESGLKSYFDNNSVYEEIVVEEVLSVDIIRLENEEKIKLIGIKAPKTPPKEKIERDEKGIVVRRKDISLKTLEESAFDFVDELLKGKKVRLEFDVHKNSPQGTPAYVFLVEDNSFVNAEVLRQGFAYLQISPPNTKYEQELRDAYQEARREKRGLQGE